MHPFPHRYRVAAAGGPEASVRLTGEGLPALETAPPAEFDGPGDHWSPETLLVAAVADCFVLTFRAIARASRFAWESLACEAEGVLDRAEGGTRFTRVALRATLRVPAGANEAQAHRLLEKAERGCLVTRSLVAEPELEASVEVAR
jgi:peroxiredoxin-like protein